ncbi:protodermal factor 1 isoform X2 [Cajanus cajan]|uniref:protodermal factor 1 isoform X2 n=1 Tax=Cajanus cajan TaxID=3821 RepID=UPI00098D9ECA|nr:protodermal factor 1 isoform X2 [Cajanus cajan]
MERKRSHVSITMFTMLLGLLSQHLIIPVISTTVEDQKNYWPDPHAGSSPTGSHSPPPTSHGHGSSPPSHGGGSYRPTPSAPSGGNCGSSSPPHHDPTPSTPSTPSNPPSGGYYNNPPSHGGGSPPTPVTVSPPTTPVDPGTPSIPSPPFIPSPSPFTGTCNYWRSHPGIIWGILGWWGTLGSAFGATSTIPGFSPGMSLPQALSNTRNDGLGALYREGTASFLNSLVNNKFPYTTNQVRDRFVESLSSNKAAAAQAQLFKMANEGRMKPRP